MPTEIKDKAPNQATIDMLEKALERAKSGEIRTVLCVYGYDDDSWSSGWSIDSRSSSLRLLGAVTQFSFQVQTNNALADEDNVLTQAFDN